MMTLIQDQIFVKFHSIPMNMEHEHYFYHAHAHTHNTNTTQALPHHTNASYLSTNALFVPVLLEEKHHQLKLQRVIPPRVQMECLRQWLNDKAPPVQFAMVSPPCAQVENFGVEDCVAKWAVQLQQLLHICT